jgi:hypothetical protein
VGDLRAVTGAIGVAGAGDHLADADLLRLEAKGKDETALAADRRVCDAAEAAEDDDVAAGVISAPGLTSPRMTRSPGASSMTPERSGPTRMRGPSQPTGSGCSGCGSGSGSGASIVMSISTDSSLAATTTAARRGGPTSVMRIE